MIALLAGLGAFILVGGAGAAIFLATSGDDKKDPTTSSQGSNPTTSTPTVDTGTDTGPTTTNAPKPASFVVKVCAALTADRRCSRPAFTRSGNIKQFFVWLSVRDGESGKKVSIALRDTGTGQEVVKPAKFTATGQKLDIFTYKITGGPFANAKIRITTKYDGGVIKFKPPTTLTFK